jgi:hypothetical protein
MARGDPHTLSPGGRTPTGKAVVVIAVAASTSLFMFAAACGLDATLLFAGANVDGASPVDVVAVSMDAGDAVSDARVSPDDSPVDARTPTVEGDCGSFSLPPASSLVDDFTSASPSPSWFVPPPNDCIQQVDDSLVATPLANTVTSFCLAVTVADYHLECDSIAMRVPKVTTTEVGVQTIIYVDAVDSQKHLFLVLENGGFQLVSGQSDGGTASVSLTGAYDATKDLWWRLREAGGAVYFDTAPDGVTWTTRGTTPDPFPLDDVNIFLGAGAYKAVANPGQASFQCYNVPAATCP